MILTGMLLVLLMIGVALANRYLSSYLVRVLNTACIYVVAAVGYNLINGITGQFSLGPNGFMAIGGYTVAILMLPLA